MKEQTIFVTDDGQRFDDRVQAEWYDAQLAEVTALLSRLTGDIRPLQDNGSSFVQLPHGTKAILQAIHEKRPRDYPMMNPWSKLHDRIQCIDDHDREWQRGWQGGDRIRSARCVNVHKVVEPGTAAA